MLLRKYITLGITNKAYNKEDTQMRVGFVDIQVNGCGGIDFNNGALSCDDVYEATKYLWSKGVTKYLPTIITNDPKVQKRAIKSIITARNQDSRLKSSIVGIHLEGPYISPMEGPRGAHNPDYIRDPDWDEFQELQDVAEGLIKIVTLAPERDGTIPFIKKAVREGIIIGIGHTAASNEQIGAAISAGAQLSTHLGNGAHKQLDRNQNYIQYQLSQDALKASFIADGHHIPFPTLKNYFRAKEIARSILTSDSIAATGLGPGKYQLVGMDVEVQENGFTSLVGTPFLAGSTLNMLQAVENVAKFVRPSFDDVIQMAADNPANLLKIPKDELNSSSFAEIEWKPGDDFTTHLKVINTIIKGDIVWKAT